MKKHAGLITILVLASLAAVVLTACSKDDTSYRGLKHVLDERKAQENKK